MQYYVFKNPQRKGQISVREVTPDNEQFVKDVPHVVVNYDGSVFDDLYATIMAKAADQLTPKCEVE